MAVIGGQSDRQHGPRLPDAPRSQRIRRFAWPWCGNAGNGFAQSRATSAEPGLAAPTQQVPHQHDRRRFGFTAGRRRIRPGAIAMARGADRVIDQHVHLDE